MVLHLVCHGSLTPETVCFDLNDLVEGFSVFYTTGSSVVELVAIIPKFMEDFGEGRPWWNIVDCFSGSYKLVMHLST
jgi:hypothetical protein